MKSASAEWTGLDGRPSGYVCPAPFFYEVQGEVYQRECGKCARCIAAKKRDLVGRAAAESVTSDEVVFYTLTYRPGEVGAFKWVTKDRQAFLKRLRAKLWEDARQHVGAPVRLRGPVREYWKPIIAAACKRVRYFGAGEVGQRGTKRNHWHVVAFISGGRPGPSGIESTPREESGKAGREVIKMWPHGHVNIQVLPGDAWERVKAIRYCAVYLQKARETFTSEGVTRAAAVMFRSLKPSLGAAFLKDQAAEYVAQGLPLASFYTVPGVEYSKGVRRGQRTKNYLSGVSRDLWVRSYRDAFLARHGPDVDMPHSDFLQRFDADYIARRRPESRRKRLGGLSRPKREHLPPQRNDLAAVLPVVAGRRTLGMVSMLRNGVCVWVPVIGPPVVVPESGFQGVGLRDEVLESRVDAWASARRGPDWLSPRQRFEWGEERRVARVLALVRAFQSDRSSGKPGVPSEVVPLTGMRRALAVREVRLDGSKVWKDGRRVYRTMSLVAPDGTPNRRVYRQPSAERLLERDGFPPFVWEKPVVSVRRPLGQPDWPDKPRWMRVAP